MLTPKNWPDFQHYGKRRPPWIKLHRSLLDNIDFLRLPVESRALAPLLWLIASEFEDGRIDLTLDDLAYRLRMEPASVASALIALIRRGFFSADREMLAQVASETLAPEASALLARCEQDATLRREEREGESNREGNSLRVGSTSSAREPLTVINGGGK